jgi:hypothetical protein
MYSLYERCGLIGFVKINKPQINADERRLRDVLGKSVWTIFGVSTIKGEGFSAI